ncbi:hypothetical protein [Thiomicrospira sp. WB1]|uniref:hypothetical protein n=1 Tax=Thiomicrospira sp. WB1 TaxID=1685380 RepID=UPI0007466457|nr:hypothetical protein [Thiomicrospira sp. WB1]KUJ72903.1 hypothetical protein AVO41_03740 [Thiomicrospira sp. WB1]
MADSAVSRQWLPWRRLLHALIAQLLALLLLAGGVWFAPALIDPPYEWSVLIWIQGALAWGVTRLFGLPRWWGPIQLLLPVGLYFGANWSLSPWWALGAFALIYLFFANALTERVPLYLTNSLTRRALVDLVRPIPSVRFMDLGCGFGANVVAMSREHNVIESQGVETAPIPFAVSWARSRIQGGQVFARNLWHLDLSRYNVVYAFLSPEPMPGLWLKVVQEMPEQSVFVSNSFAVPDVAPDEVLTLSDRRQTQLFVYYPDRHRSDE